MNLSRSVDNYIVGDMVKSTSDLYSEFIANYAEQTGLNRMQVPRIDSLILTTGYGKLHKDSNVIEAIIRDFTLIAMQKPVRCSAKKSISNFKLREGSEIAATVTLRNAKMFNWLDHLIMIAMPRIENFQGFSINAFDKHNNFNFGIKNHHSFIVPVSNLVFGFNVCIKMKYSVKDEKFHQGHKKHVINLLEYLRIPFWNKGGMK